LDSSNASTVNLSSAAVSAGSSTLTGMCWY
jgi:hypothetical protein